MQKPKKRLTRRNGTVTALILLFALVLSLLGAATLRMSMHQRRFAVRSANIVTAKTAADAGLEKTIHNFKKMLQSQSVDLALLDQTAQPVLNSNAAFDSTVSADASGAYQIESTGYTQGVRRTVRATVKLRGLFENVISVKNELYLSPGSQIVGINSLDPLDTDLGVTMGTASTASDKIPMGPGTFINGDVYVGVGGVPSTVITGSGTVTGNQYALAEAMVFPVITPPTYATTQPIIAVNGVTKTLTPVDNGRYGGLELSKDGSQEARLIIDGGKVILHITGDLTIGSVCEIIINPGSSLFLYLDGDSFSGTDSTIENRTNNPKALQIFATGAGAQLLQFKPKVETFGLVYAPNATVEIAPQANIKGAIVAYDFRLLSNGTFTYDKAVQTVSIDETGVSLAMDRWSE